MFGSRRGKEKKENQKKVCAEQKSRERKVREKSPGELAMIAFLNKYSLIFHVFLACGICFLIEWVSRHSFLEACYFVVDRNLVFLYNSMIVFVSLMLVYMVKRRAVTRTVISVFWLFLGIINGCVLAKRVTPFSFTDIKMLGDLFTMQSNYFTATEACLVIAGVAAVVLLLVVLWFKGPKYQGKTHRVMGALMTFAVLMMVPGVTDAAVSNHVLTDYFENLAQGYKDYGFVYSFSSSVLDRGMSTPDGYSEEAVSQVLAKISGEETDGDSRSNLQTGSVTDDSDSESAAAQNTVTGNAEVQTTVSGNAAVQTTASGNAEAQNVTAENTETQNTVTAAAESSAEIRSARAIAAGGIIEETDVRTAAAEEETAEKEMEAGTEMQTTEAENEIQGESGEVQPIESGIPEEEEEAEQEYPNIICILLESFVDPELVNFLELSDEVVPNFHYLYDNYTSGYLEVPVVGAGTANTEFEILTGMGMQFFGLGEYPYKTILKETNCESVAADLNTLGYGTHVVHNNGGNFYSRRNAFSMMGFDTFTSKELMDIHDYTPLGTWPTDDILVGEVEKSLDYTEDAPDFVYTITVEGHGDYPKEQVLEDPAIQVSGVEDEGMHYAWEYYVNQIHEVDDFIGDLIEMLEQREEKTLVVMFGDHLPTMGLTEEDMATGSLFKTQYATWNNFGLEKNDEDLTSYQLLSKILNDLDIHTGTMVSFHQNRDKYATEEEYQESMELLQYDILYGEHYVYGGENPYPASDLIMGTQEVVIDQIMETDNYYYVIGDNFTRWSKIYVNDTKISTSYCSSKMLRFKKDKLDEGMNRIVVCQVGSSESIFRTSNQVSYLKAAARDE